MRLFNKSKLFVKLQLLRNTRINYLFIQKVWYWFENISILSVTIKFIIIMAREMLNSWEGWRSCCWCNLMHTPSHSYNILGCIYCTSMPITWQSRNENSFTNISNKYAFTGHCWSFFATKFPNNCLCFGNKFSINANVT